MRPVVRAANAIAFVLPRSRRTGLSLLSPATCPDSRRRRARSSPTTVGVSAISFPGGRKTSATTLSGWPSRITIRRVDQNSYRRHTDRAMQRSVKFQRVAAPDTALTLASHRVYTPRSPIFDRSDDYRRGRPNAATCGIRGRLGGDGGHRALGHGPSWLRHVPD